MEERQTVNIDLAEYKKLIEVKERMEILKDFLSGTQYATVDQVQTIIGTTGQPKELNIPDLATMNIMEKEDEL